MRNTFYEEQLVGSYSYIHVRMNIIKINYSSYQDFEKNGHNLQNCDIDMLSG